MLVQLNPCIPLDTPKGPALAYMVIDYGPDADLQWVAFITETRECWTFRNPEVRLAKNWTMGNGRAFPEDVVWWDHKKTRKKTK